MTFNLPPPDLQVSFALKLAEARALFLQDALKDTVRRLDIVELDKQLAACAPRAGLSILASHGLRGELVFPVPLILESNPRLLAYYRLLYGYSQKQFYTAATGMGRFKGNGGAGDRCFEERSGSADHVHPSRLDRQHAARWSRIGVDFRSLSR